jgi:hypothetical protein
MKKKENNKKQKTRTVVCWFEFHPSVLDRKSRQDDCARIVAARRRRVKRAAQKVEKEKEEDGGLASPALNVLVDVVN